MSVRVKNKPSLIVFIIFKRSGYLQSIVISQKTFYLQSTVNSQKSENGYLQSTVSSQKNLKLAIYSQLSLAKKRLRRYAANDKIFKLFFLHSFLASTINNNTIKNKFDIL